MFSDLRYFILAIVLTGLAGCGNATPGIAGGTAGKLSFGNDVSSDIRITVYEAQAGSFRPIGFGNSAADGSFVLYSPAADEPLWLQPGDYAFTLESLGPPVQFPDEYLNAETSPLKVTWSVEMPTLELKAPEELIAQ